LRLATRVGTGGDRRVKQLASITLEQAEIDIGQNTLALSLVAEVG
jgi:hypothetical protein